MEDDWTTPRLDEPRNCRGCGIPTNGIKDIGSNEREPVKGDNPLGLMRLTPPNLVPMCDYCAGKVARKPL